MSQDVLIMLGKVRMKLIESTVCEGIYLVCTLVCALEKCAGVLAPLLL